MIQLGLRYVVLCAVLALLVAACSGDSSISDMRYLPVRVEGEAQWSILDTESGKLVHRNRLRNRPSAVVAGLFVEEGVDGFFRCYSVDDEECPVCDEQFTQLGQFTAPGVTFAVKENGAITIVDKRFNKVCQLPANVSRARAFNYGRAAYCQNGKWGYIDTEGRDVIKPEFAEASDFAEGRAFVQKTDHILLIDDDGDEVCRWPVGAIVPQGKFVDGYAPVLLSGRKTYVDRSGEEVTTLPEKKETALASAIASKYAAIQSLTIKPVRFMAYDGKAWVLIDDTGKRLSDCRFAEFGAQEERFASFYSEATEVAR